MSVIERMEQINRDKEEAERQVRKLEEGKSRDHSQGYIRELPEVGRWQAILLEELRSLGIVAMVEEVGERQIMPLADFEHPELLHQRIILSPEDVKKMEKEFFRYRKWVASIKRPVLSEDGVWDFNLKIEIRRNTERKCGFTGYLGRENDPLVNMEYSTKGILTIEGEEVTFCQPVPKDEAGRIEIVETALAKALLNPKMPEVRHVPSHSWDTQIYGMTE